MSSVFNSLKYGCLKASLTEILLAGSNSIILVIKSKPTLSKFLKNCSGFTPLNLGKVGL